MSYKDGVCPNCGGELDAHVAINNTRKCAACGHTAHWMTVAAPVGGLVTTEDTEALVFDACPCGVPEIGACPHCGRWLVLLKGRDHIVRCHDASMGASA